MHRFAGLLFVSTAVFLAACSSMYQTAISYTPSAPPLPPGSRTVSLTVVDERPPEEGGKDPARVGTIRSDVGIPAGMHESSPDAPRRHVEAATRDGLALAGLAVAEGAPETAEVRIRRLWMDGYSTYTAKLEGTLTIRKDGREVLSTPLSVESTGAQAVAAGAALFNETWGWTLTKWKDAVAAAVRGGGSTAAVASAAAEKGYRLTVTLPYDTFQSSLSPTFTTAARECLRKAGRPDDRAAVRALRLEVVPSFSPADRNGKVNYQVRTRTIVQDEKGEVLSSGSFETKGFYTKTTYQPATYQTAEIGTHADVQWCPVLIRTLESQEAGRKGK